MAKQIVDITLELGAKCGIHGATISRIAAGVEVARSALCKCYPTAFEHPMGTDSQSGTLGMSVFESSTKPWFQFAAAIDGTGRLTQEPAQRQLVFIRDFAVGQA